MNPLASSLCSASTSSTAPASRNGEAQAVQSVGTHRMILALENEVTAVLMTTMVQSSMNVASVIPRPTYGSASSVAT